MLKSVFASILIVLSISSFSQKFEGGFFGGLSASQIDGDKNSGYNKIGLTIGAFTTLEINRNIDWKAEIRYIQKGSYIPSTFDKTTLQYAEVPLLLQYFINEKIFIEGGFVPEILLATKVEDKNGVYPSQTINQFHTFEFEETIGAGYYLTKNLAAGIRSTYSLFPAGGRAPGPTYIFHRGEYNNVLSFTLYYHIH
jgi:hypothetical protein